ncbi:uncharacterized protein LOC107044384 [Diachasma alloeum]|uniref:uncharacterized protein LOC107044384 n=1 Tax=Diachasma alloeum TaxID=454923 RepID=UPI0007383778|nr:uncharacterized protein LOC107044384 [Diachasma alloeum]
MPLQHSPTRPSRNNQSATPCPAMASIEDLKHKRTGFKTRLTKNKNWVEKEGADARAEHLEAKLETLIEKFKEWEISNEELCALDMENEEANTRAADEIEENFHYLKGFIKCIINTKLLPTQREHPPIQAIHGPAPPRKSQSIKLPEISLPNFDGRYEKYRGFRDQFNARLGNNPETEDVVKLQYLQTCLTGPATETIANLDLQASNYRIAWTLLDEKFDRPRQALPRHWQTLLDLCKQPRKSEIEIVNIMRQQVQCLSGYGNAQTLLNAVFTTLIINALDTEVIFQWETTVEGNDMPDYNQLLKFIEKRGICAEITGRETIKQKPSQAPSKGSTQKSSTGGQKTTNHSSTSSVPRAQTFMTTNTRKCPVCAEIGHRIYECPKFEAMNVSQRDKFIRNENRCLNCLAKGHGYNECSSKTRCKICKEKHHSKIHIDRGGPSAKPEA